MQRFVAGSDRPGSSQGQRPGTANRRQQIGANAKIAVNRATQGQQEHAQQNNTARRQSSHNAHGAVPQPQQNHRQNVPAPHVKPEHMFDTDASSIDTTVALSQRNEPAHGQYHDGNGQPQFNDGEEDENGEYSSEYDGVDDDEFQGVADFDAQDMMQGIPFSQQKEIAARMAQGGGMFNGDDSYPTTTSGRPDESEEDEVDNQSHMSPTPPPQAAGFARRQSAGHPNPVQRIQNAHGAAHPAQNNMQLFQQGATLRENNRTGATTKEPPVQPLQRPTTELPSSQPPGFSLVPRQHTAVGSINTNMNPASQRQPNPGLPQRGSGARTTTTAALAHSGKPAKPTQSRAHIVPQTSNKPPSPEPSEEDAGDHGQSEPIEDYDRPALFEMKYEDLKIEDFDHVPRAPHSVLPEDQLESDLDNRLQYVQGNLNEADQARFFAELKMTEWEDVGDWFLDRFSDIIKRTQEARKAKRSLAAEFEQEVEKRHRHVEKKRRTVDSALEEMSHQGQVLLPEARTPRKSRTPGRTSKSPTRRR